MLAPEHSRKIFKPYVKSGKGHDQQLNELEEETQKKEIAQQ